MTHDNHETLRSLLASWQILAQNARQDGENTHAPRPQRVRAYGFREGLERAMNDLRQLIIEMEKREKEENPVL